MSAERLAGRKRVGATWLLFGGLWSWAACGQHDAPDVEPLEVLVASSMQDVFRQVKREFEARHPKAEVSLSVAGSQVLRMQVVEGGIGDIFVSANRAHIDSLASAGRVREVHPFAEGQLALVIAPTMQSRVRRFEDIESVDRLVVGAPAVPVGAYTEMLFRRTESAYGAAFTQALRSKIVSEESNVRLVRAKVLLGEADAAFVYESDVRVGSGLFRIAIPQPVNVRTTHWVAFLRNDSLHPQADSFLRFIRSPPVRRLLKEQGFRVEP